MSRSRFRFLGLFVLVALVGAACGDSGDDASGGGSGDSANGGAAATSGERIDTGAGEAVLWGDGSYGVVLAHGAAFVPVGLVVAMAVTA